MAQRTEEPQLSDRERTVLLLAADGLTDKEIAKHLGISLKTVGTYWDRMRQKCAASSRTQVLAHFLRIQVLESEEPSSFKRLFATWEEGVWVLGRQGETIYANERIAEIFGVGNDDLIGRRAVEAVGTLNAPKLRRLLSSSKVEPATAELAIRRPDGDTHWLYLRATPFEDARGRPGATVILVQDTTLQKRVQHTLSSCESVLGFLMEHVSDCVARFDSELRLTYINPWFCDMLSAVAGEIVGRKVEELEKVFAPNVRWLRYLERAMRTGQPQRFEAQIAGLKLRRTTYLLPEPSADFVPQGIISLTRCELVPPVGK